MEQNIGGYTVERKLRAVGREKSESYIVTLPKLWVESRGLADGAVLELTFDDSEVIVLRPRRGDSRSEEGVAPTNERPQEA